MNYFDQFIKAIDELPEKEKRILCTRNGIDILKTSPSTLQEVSKLFSVTIEQVRQIETKVNEKLRDKMQN